MTRKNRSVMAYIETLNSFYDVIIRYNAINHHYTKFMFSQAGIDDELYDALILAGEHPDWDIVCSPEVISDLLIGARVLLPIVSGEELVRRGGQSLLKEEWNWLGYHAYITTQQHR